MRRQPKIDLQLTAAEAKALVRLAGLASRAILAGDEPVPFEAVMMREARTCQGALRRISQALADIGVEAPHIGTRA